MGNSIGSPLGYYSSLSKMLGVTQPTTSTEDVEWEIEGLGRVLGKTFEVDEGRKVHAFLGVPFAKCGSGQDRFKKPQPIEPWEGVRDCRDFGPRSLQIDMFWDYLLTPVPQNEENCLHVNIFVPELDESEKTGEGIPVMTFLHGGGFVMQSSANYGDKQICRNLCKHGVIVCVIQYRLGLLGFMSTGTPECAGNWGLWDQREAFLWIQKYINSFGGDKNNVTAFGQSAGAASIDLLSVSPHCRGLFKRMILMGGNAASEWSLGRRDRIIDAAAEVAIKAGWKGSTDNPSDLVSFLRQLPSEQCKAVNPIFSNSVFNRNKNGLVFVPVVDGDFLPEPVAELRKKAPKVHAIIGTTDFEALLFIAIGRRAQSDMVSFEKQLQVSIPSDCRQFELLRDEARNLYLSKINAKDKVEVAKSFMRLYSDSLMNNSTHTYVDLMTAAGHEIYLYNFTYCNPSSFGLFAYRVPFIGATHCYELRYLFGKGMFSKFRPNSDDLKMLDMMTRMFTNYAKSGNPNYNPLEPIWHPTTQENTYLHLQFDVVPKFIDNYQERRAQFWEKVDRIRHQDENSNEVK
ncbi:COesterase domain-containing protein [Aphelenchoides bicaudatus]|nr:COesterase domain-containing protein [Aphelenchoides bicaudatus]